MYTHDQLLSLSGANILLVEDGDTNRKLIGLMLRRVGVQVTTAENGQVVAELAMKHPFDLILMDMQMPVMDGYIATALLRQQGIAIPIIALTAHAMKGDEDKCLAAGCSAYVTKPVDADALVETVAEMLAAMRRGPLVAERCRRRPRPGQPGCGPRPRRHFRRPPPRPSRRPSSPPSPWKTPSSARSSRNSWTCCNRGSPPCSRPWRTRPHRVGPTGPSAKGAGGTAGFAVLTEPARRLEACVRDQQCDAIEAAVADSHGAGQTHCHAPGGGRGQRENSSRS